MAGKKTENQNGYVTVACLQKSLKPINATLVRLETVVKMNISEQKRVNENLKKEIELMESERKKDISGLWKGIKKNTDRIWGVKVALAFMMGFTILVGGGALIGKLAGWW